MFTLITMVNAVLAHFVADYLLQPKQMALRKSSPGLVGNAWCIAHCAIYTLCVCAFTSWWNPAFAGLVFISHWLPDRFSLASHWLRVIHGRDLESEMRSQAGPEREVRISFACLVYAISDNTIHLVIIWWIIRWLA